LEKKGSDTIIIDGRFEVVLPDVQGEKKTVSAAPAGADGGAGGGRAAAAPAAHDRRLADE
jgi:hypothetical protein